jgi:hypothetical protein
VSYSAKGLHVKGYKIEGWERRGAICVLFSKRFTCEGIQDTRVGTRSLIERCSKKIFVF